MEDRIEYLVKYWYLPIQNSEWIDSESIDKSLRIEFDKKLEQSNKIKKITNKRYHHIGQNNM